MSILSGEDHSQRSALSHQASLVFMAQCLGRVVSVVHTLIGRYMPFTMQGFRACVSHYFSCTGKVVFAYGEWWFLVSRFALCLAENHGPNFYVK